MQKRPISLVVLSLLFFLAGLTAVLVECLDWSGPGLYVELSFNQFNFAILFVGIGPGLYFLKNGWRICALGFVWCTIALILLVTLPSLILTPSLSDFSSANPADINPLSVFFRYAPMYTVALCVYWALSNEQVQRLFKRVESPSTAYKGVVFSLWIVGVTLLPALSVRYYVYVQELESLYASIETELQPEIEFIKNHPGDSNHIGEEIRDALADPRILEACVILSQSGNATTGHSLKITKDENVFQQFPANVGDYQIGSMTMKSGEVYPYAIYNGQTHDGLPFEMIVDTSTFPGPKY